MFISVERELGSDNVQTVAVAYRGGSFCDAAVVRISGEVVGVGIVFVGASAVLFAKQFQRRRDRSNEISKAPQKTSNAARVSKQHQSGRTMDSELVVMGLLMLGAEE